ncbi:hypothetical protein ACLK19_24295 [Escherichia coli]
MLGTLEYSLPTKNLIQGIAGAMHFRSEDDRRLRNWQHLLLTKVAGGAGTIPGLDANSEVVSEVVTLIKQCNKGGPGAGQPAPNNRLSICRQQWRKPRPLKTVRLSV